MNWFAQLVTRVGGALLAILLTTSGQAELRWDRHTIEHNAGINEKIVRASFAFENTGTKAVTIISTKSSCGCTTATPTKQTYAPGESGAIEAIFEIGDRKGHQNKAIWVTTDERPDSPTKLTLLVTIPSLLEIEPRIVWWGIGANPKEQSILINVHPDAEVTIDDIQSNNSAVTHRLETLSSHRYKLLLKPVSTEKKLRATLQLKVTPQGGSTRSSPVFARVN